MLGSVMRTEPLQGPPELAVAGPDVAFRKRKDGGYTVARRNKYEAFVVPVSACCRNFLGRRSASGTSIGCRFVGRRGEGTDRPALAVGSGEPVRGNPYAGPLTQRRDRAGGVTT